MKKEKGITLIALVITIIVMMILVAVTVSIAVNGGLFSYAGRAAKGTDQEKVREEIQSIIPMYYLEQNKPDGQTFQEFLTANLGEGNVVGFSPKIETTFSEGQNVAPTATTIIGYTFFYKGYGFFVEKDSLRISLLEDMDEMTSSDSYGIYELITNINDLEVGKKYIIVSSNTENNTDAYFVMDEYDEGINENEEQYARRRNQLYPANENTILYTGNYAITIEKDGNNYHLYDSYNKEYLSVEGNDEENKNYLGLGEKNEYSKVSINISNGTAQIKFLGRETRNVIKNSSFITSCYSAGQTGLHDICLYKYIGTEVKDKLETPTDIIATPDYGKVTLQWNEVEGAYSYTVTQQDEEGNQTKQVVTENTAVFDELENGYTYLYQIRANSNGGAKANSAWTEARQVVPGSGIFELVTSNSMLEAGTRYIIATRGTAGSGFTVGAQNGNYRERIAVTIESNNTILYDDSYYPLRLEGSTDSWKWKDLKTNKNEYLLGGTKTAWGYNKADGRTEQCSILISSSNVASIQYNTFYIKHNSSASRFTGYASGQGDIYLYKEVGAVSLATPIVTAMGIDRTAKLEWNMVQGVTYYLVWNGVESNTVITSPHTISNLTNGIEYTYQIKAVKDEEVKYSTEGTVTPIATKTYQLVTSISSADSGKAFLIVKGKTVGTQLAMGEPGEHGESNQNYVSQQNVNVLNTNPVSIEYSEEDSYKYILEYNNTNSAWKIRESVSNKYLYTPFDGNTLRAGNSETMAEDNTNEWENIDLFNITFDSTDGHLNISGFNSNLNSRSIRYNSQATRFSFYSTSTQEQVYLFKCID